MMRLTFDYQEYKILSDALKARRNMKSKSALSSDRDDVDATVEILRRLGVAHDEWARTASDKEIV